MERRTIAGTLLMTPEQLEARRLEIEEELGEPITLDGLTKTWSIFQRKKGHRHSTDDLLTGWYALHCLGIAGARPDAPSGDAPVGDASFGAARSVAPLATSSTQALTRPSLPLGTCLDLGTGIGGVGLLVLSVLTSTKLTCVEAQDVSYRFLLENIRANGVGSRVRAIHGDLRHLDLGDERFPLVTGSPPYFDVSAGIVPADSQKAHARFELRGDVRDYARAARRYVARDGLFVFCFPWQQRQRAIDAATQEGFASIVVRDVVPREGLTPLFSLYACSTQPLHRTSPAPTPPTTCLEEPPFVVRHEDGSHTAEMLAVRSLFGFTTSLEKKPAEP